MCSRLHVQLSSGLAELQLGDPVPFMPQGATAPAEGTWGVQMASDVTCGFARVETFREKWLTKHWRTGTIEAAEFAEGHKEQRWSGTGGRVACLWRTLGGVTDVVVLTRQATKTEQARLRHHRVPVKVADGKLVLPRNGDPDWFGNGQPKLL